METEPLKGSGCVFLGEGYVIDKKYRVLEFIGEGGVSCVYLAEHVYTGRKVALKIPKPDVLRQYPRLYRNFLKEPLKTPKHPGVIEIFDAGEDSQLKLPYLVTEYLKTSLRKLLDKGLEKERGLKIILKVAETLKDLHENGVYHLDLKPENILIDWSGNPKIADFGFAKFKADTYKRSSAIWGTPVYTAPEVWEGEYSEKSDVYSLGVMLAEVLTGKPYGRNIEDEKLRKLAEQATNPEPNQRPSLREFIKTLKTAIEKPKPLHKPKPVEVTIAGKPKSKIKVMARNIILASILDMLLEWLGFHGVLRALGWIASPLWFSVTTAAGCLYGPLAGSLTGLISGIVVDLFIWPPFEGSFIADVLMGGIAGLSYRLTSNWQSLRKRALASFIITTIAVLAYWSCLVIILNIKYVEAAWNILGQIWFGIIVGSIWSSIVSTLIFIIIEKRRISKQ